MDLVPGFVEVQSQVLAHAQEGLGRAHLTHYETAGIETSNRRLEELLQLVLRCLDQRDLGPITQYSELVATERFNAGFDIAEVQTAFNVLEEAIWHVVIPRIPPDELVEACGLVGTVLGVGKDVLARTWVQLATSRHVPSLNLGALFEGIEN
jgi:hypothetical protein